MSTPNPNCERCHGTGLVTITIGGDGYGDKCCGTMDCDDQPCTSCDDYETPEEAHISYLDELHRKRDEAAAEAHEQWCIGRGIDP